MKLTGNRCQCKGCGEYFNSAKTFDAHRGGPFAPINRPSTRRCLSVVEMQAKGWLRNAAGFWISGKRPIGAVTRAVGAVFALTGYWIASDVLEATAPLRDGLYANRGRHMIGGALDVAALARLHFTVLSQDEQANAIRRLAASGQGEHTIAHATGLSVEQIRRVLTDVQPS